MTEFKPVQFGKYILLDKIAAGGMAELYRAKITGAKGFEKLIAVKKILPHLADEDALISSFIDEAKLAAFLQHQNIVQIYDFGSMGDAYFIAMEYLLGKDLKFVMKKADQADKPLSLENALHITARICDGLYYAHNLKDFHGNPLNIIHRDIGPHNIFITYDGLVKIIDFGIARAATQNTTTREGLVKGKIAYMSPEQAMGQKIDHQSDIFSIGIVLYELVTKKPMFVGDTYQIYSKVCKAEFDPPESINKNLPSDLYEVLNKALAREPDQRYQSADEMAVDLDKCISSLSFHPSDRTLSQYLKMLFEKEAGTEGHAMREAAALEHTEVPDSHEGSTKAYEETMLLDTNDMSGKPKQRTFLYLGLGLFLIVLGVVFAIILFGNPAGMFHKKETVFLGSVEPEKASSSSADNEPEEPDPPELIEGENLIKEERFAEAVALFEAIPAKNPLMKDHVGVLYSRALLGQAAKLEEIDPEKAILLLLKSLEAVPVNASANYMLGRIYTQQKDYPKAILSYKQAAELDPGMPQVFFNLGYIYYAVNKDYSTAQEMYQRVVELSPSFLDEALINLALAQKKLGKNKDCIKNLERAIRINPENKQAKKLLNNLKEK